jgi:exopolysaccharide biosynthesis polyprenyl glycosylphosphotransferase
VTSSPSAVLIGHRLLLALWNRRGLFLLIMDLAAVFLSFLIAYYLRFHVDWVVSALPPPPDEGIPPIEPYVKVSAISSLVWAFLLLKEKTYQNEFHLSRTLAHQLRLVLVTGFYAAIFLMVISSMFRYFLLSRLVYLMGIVLSCIALILVRFCLDLLDRHLCNARLISSRVLLLGSRLNTGLLLPRLRKLSRCIQVIGRLTPNDGSNGTPGSISEVPTLGTERDLERIYSETPFDQLILGSRIRGAADDEALVRVINFCEEKGVSVYMVPDSLDVVVRRREVGTLAGLPFVALKDSSVHPVYPLVKRTMDMVISLAVLVAGLPLWLLIALLIKLTSKGPVFYVQQRAGLHGKPFAMRKFRSMVDRAHDQLKELVNFDELPEPSYHLHRDPRVTPLGRILRRTSLDEIPQFIHVLCGTMSIVGPRPELTELVQRYNPYQRRRLKAKPGITGYQQVMDHGEPSLARRIDFDLHYLKYQSLALDLYIMARTVYVLIKGDGKR